VISPFKILIAEAGLTVREVHRQGRAEENQLKHLEIFIGIVISGVVVMGGCH
jgi:hypothetical protein